MNIKRLAYGAGTIVLLGALLFPIGFLGCSNTTPASRSDTPSPVGETTDATDQSDVEASAEPVLYHCPNHPHEHSTDTDALCPIDGERMVSVP